MSTRAWIPAIFALNGVACSFLIDPYELGTNEGSDAAAVADGALIDGAERDDSGAIASDAVAGDASGDAKSDAGGDATPSDGSSLVDVRAALVGEWLFADPGADAAIDTSGNGRTGSLTGDAVLAAGGKRDGTLALDGGGNLSVLELDLTAFPRTGTLCLWMRRDAPPLDGGNHGVFDSWDGARNHLFVRWGASGSSADTFQFAAQYNDNTYASETKMDFPRDAWAHIAITWDESALEWRVHTNGVEAVRRKWTAPFVPTQQRMRIGDGFVGAIDEVRLFNRALSGSEIAELL